MTRLLHHRGHREHGGRRGIILLVVLGVLCVLRGETPLFAQPSTPTVAALPVYVALRPDLQAFRAFADGGWDGNWYVGFNTCWIVKLPKPPAGAFVRAFLGERLGRAKTRPRPGAAAWDRDPLPGKVYMAIASTPAFSPAQSFFLADTQDIPQEPDYENPNLAVGHGEWFWTEIPLKLVNFDGPNYLATWSNSEALVSASSAPILGAALDVPPSQEGPRAWLNNSVAGVPPRDLSSPVGVAVSFYLPSLVLKLVPSNDAKVAIRGFAAAASGDGYTVRFAVAAQDAESAWVETSPDGMGWERLTGLARHPPYLFTIPAARLGRAYGLSGALYLRGVAEDAFGNLGFSETVQFPYNAQP